MATNKNASYYLSALDAEIRAVISTLDKGNGSTIYDMLAYHFGWEDDGTAYGTIQGKRIRPLLTLLTCEASGGDWEKAVPAAASIEMIHNFSLIHDDIEDNSSLRRGRTTLWKKWGVPQAINTGDALYTLAFLVLQRMDSAISAQSQLALYSEISNACLELTRGQNLDIAFENKERVSLEDYLAMIKGKTATLLSACCAIGAMVSDAPQETISAYREFGNYLGLAFQVQDDLLGVWGNTDLTGKSAQSDLISGKKSIPILHALQESEDFQKRWIAGPLDQEDIPAMIQFMEAAGSNVYTKSLANELTDKATAALKAARPQGEAGEALFDLSVQLLHRNY